jgi:hypothetical protein
VLASRYAFPTSAHHSSNLLNRAKKAINQLPQSETTQE